MDPQRQIVLLMVAATLALGAVFQLKRRGRRGAGYAALLGGNLALALCALYVAPDQTWLFATAVALFCALVLVPAILQGVTRRLMASGRWRAALAVLSVRQHFQPGAGLGRDRQVLAWMILVREGRLDEALGAAREQLSSGADESMRLAIVEQLLLLLTYARRYEEAAELARAQGGLELARASSSACSQMVRIFAEVDDLEQSAACLELLEDKAAGGAALGPLVLNSARLAFVAHVGGAEAVDRLVAPTSKALPGLQETHRKLWRGLALARAGRLQEAQVLWRDVAEGGPPAEAEAARYRLERSWAPAPPPPAQPLVALAEQATARALAYQGVPVEGGRATRVAPVTVGLMAALAVVQLGIVLWGGENELWRLLRAGANFKPAVLGGEPWRLVSSMFMHGNWLHFGINAYALYLLGRLVEQLYGSSRFFVLYTLAGVGGSMASIAFGGPFRLSVGASGAIFGLLGAGLVAAVKLRGRVPEAWRKQLSMNLLIIVGLSLYLGFSVRVVDNAAHIGGGLGGALVALFLGRWEGRPSARGSRLSMVLALLLAGGTLVCGGLALRTSIPQTLARLPQRAVKKGGMRLSVPQHWEEVPSGADLAYRDPLVGLLQPPTVVMSPPDPLTPGQSLMAYASGATEALREAWTRAKGVTRVRVVRKPRALSQDREIVESRLEITGGGDRFALIVLFRQQADLAVTLRVHLTAELTSDYEPVIRRLGRSMAYRSPS